LSPDVSKASVHLTKLCNKNNFDLSLFLDLVSFKGLRSNTKIGTFVKYNNKSKTLCTIFCDAEDKRKFKILLNLSVMIIDAVSN
jgi:hypothetical protein